MPDESNEFPLGRQLRWLALGLLILLAVALYFRDGRRVVPFGAAPAAVDSVPAR